VVTGVAGLRCSSQVEEKVEMMGNLTEGAIRKLDDEAKPAAVDQGGGGFLTRTTC
jgi:hypothetical protein